MIEIGKEINIEIQDQLKNMTIEIQEVEAIVVLVRKNMKIRSTQPLIKINIHKVQIKSTNRGMINLYKSLQTFSLRSIDHKIIFHQIIK